MFNRNQEAGKSIIDELLAHDELLQEHIRHVCEKDTFDENPVSFVGQLEAKARKSMIIAKRISRTLSRKSLDSIKSIESGEFNEFKLSSPSSSLTRSFSFRGVSTSPIFGNTAPPPPPPPLIFSHALPECENPLFINNQPNDLDEDELLL